LFVWWIVLRTSQQKKLFLKTALLCELIPKSLQSSDPKKGQEEAWRMIKEAFGGECRIRNKCLSVCQSHKQNQQRIPNMYIPTWNPSMWDLNPNSSLVMRLFCSRLASSETQQQSIYITTWSTHIDR
jgi:hypothetical protein